VGALAVNDFPCSFKANYSSWSSLAMLLLVHLLSLLSEGLGRECGVDPINVLRVISSMSR